MEPADALFMKHKLQLLNSKSLCLFCVLNTKEMKCKFSRTKKSEKELEIIAHNLFG